MYINPVTRCKAMEKTWFDFVRDKMNSKQGIRPEVYESWLRCKELGIDPYLKKAPIVLDERALAEEIEREKDLLSVALPVIEELYSVVKGSGFGVWLTNERGIILKRIVDPDLLGIVTEKGMVEGADWTEEAVGNNAIGTCLRLKQPIQLEWAEHYCQSWHDGVCSAAPILGTEGEIIGILNMTGLKGQGHPHTLGMVVAGAGAIQREYYLQTMHQKLSLSHQYFLEMIESLPSGIIVVNQMGMITSINRKACEMIKSPPEALLNRDISETFGKVDCIQKVLISGKEQEETEYYMEFGKQKLHFTICCRPIITSSETLDGAVLILREIEAVRRITSKMAGYTAYFTFDNIIGEDSSFKAAVNRAISVAPTSSNVLILGESGTGKEMFAQAIHNASNRRQGPFVAINCGALPRDLIGSELFGYEEGAFTGAKRGGSPGKFELANKGTLFLDEIGEMPMDLQMALLRVLQERKLVRLGGHQQIPVNVRIISATNKDLQRMVMEGRFRQDLYYRLNVVSILIPPLRQRIGDIEILAQYFLKSLSEKLGKKVLTLNERTLMALRGYNWPGNVRELENMLERILVFAEDEELRLHSLPTEVFEGGETCPALKYSEKALILRTLSMFKGNKSQTARHLGITRTTLYRKLRDYEIIRS